MALTEDIVLVREYIAEPNDDNDWTDPRISDWIDRYTTDGVPDLYGAAGEIWGIKASKYAELVNITESGSSRALGDLYKNAIAMQSSFVERSGGVEVAVTDRPRTRAIIRP